MGSSLLRRQIRWLYTLQSHPRVRNIVGILSTNVLNQAVAFGLSILGARLMSPGEFGILSLAIAVTTTLAIILDLGLDVSLVRYFNAEGGEHRDVSLHVTYLWKLGILFLLIVGGWPLRTLVGQLFPVMAPFELLIYISLVGAGLLNCWGTILAIKQAQRKFLAYRVLTGVYAGLRLGIFLLVFGGGRIGPTTLFIALFGGPLLLLVLYATFIDRIAHVGELIATPARERNTVIGNLLAYGGWVTVASIFFALFYRVPQLILARSASEEQLGYFGAAFTFLAVFTLFNTSIRTVLLPDVSTLQTAAGREEYHRQVWRMAPYYAGAVLLGILGLSLIQYFWLGAEYRESLPSFVTLSVGLVVLIYFGFHTILIHAIGVPELDARMNIAMTVLVAALTSLLPQTALGASIAFSTVAIMGSGGLYVLLRRTERRRAGHI